jgi:hypothetical protein
MRKRLYQIVLSVFLVGYLAVGVASHNRKSEFWKPVYKKLRWMQTSFNLWQNWGMFAPPPGSTSWMKIEGVTASGETVEIEPLFDELEPGFFRWRYDRLQKSALSSFRESRSALRKAIAHNACYRSAQAGQPVVKVNLLRDRTWVLRPSKRLKEPRPKARHKVSELGSFKCP